MRVKTIFKDCYSTEIHFIAEGVTDTGSTLQKGLHVLVIFFGMNEHVPSENYDAFKARLKTKHNAGNWFHVRTKIPP